MQRHELNSERLRLEPTRVEHAPIVFEEMSDERLWKYFPELRPKSIEELEALYRRWERGSPPDRANETWENWICFLSGTSTPVGSTQATIFPEQVAYVAYAFYRAHHGRGLAREAVRAVIEHLRTVHNIHRVLAEMDVRNERSIHLVESLGFVCVERRADVERGHGPNADEYLYELELP